MSRLGRHRGAPPSSRVQSKYFPMEGGLNLTDPALNMTAGECLAGINHEPVIPRGYRRVGGYERFDGRPAPSEATYWLLTFKEGTVEPSIGDTVTSEDGVGTPSQITGEVLKKPVVISGTWAGGTAEGYIILVNLAYAGSDTEFTVDDILTESGSPWAKVAAVEEASGVDTRILETGRTSVPPNDGNYLVVQFENGSNDQTVADGSTLRGALSNTEGALYSTVVVESGDWSTNDAAGFILIVNYSGGRFTVGEDINRISAAGGVTPFATAVDAGLEYQSDTNGVYFHYLHAAQEARRDLIEVVPGEGPVRGVWRYSGNTYAFRNKVGGASAGMYRATTSGWTEEALGYQVGFTGMDLDTINLTTADLVDETLVGATSGANGTIKRVVKQSGAYTSGDPASGEIVLSTVTGNFVCGESLVAAGFEIGTCSATQTANTLAPGGHYEFDNHNFYGSSQYFRMYGVNGVDNAFEWDGSVFVKIRTGMETDTPTHLRCYKDHLWLSFSGGSLQKSSLGEPTEWNALTGASEMGTGDEISGMAIEADNTMSIFSRNSAHILTGASGSDFQLRPFHQHMGAIEWSIQKIGQTWFLDDRGLTTLTLADTYGDFKQNSVSIKVDPFIQQRLANVQCSQIARNKNQYRLFFSDGLALFGTFDGNKVLGFMPIEYAVQPFCAESVEDTDGYEYLLMGAEDGFVYQQDIGTSFDGETISASLMVSYYHYDTPTYNKRFRGITFEMDVTDNTDIRFLPDFSYGSEEIPRAVEQENTVVGGGGLWDYVNWDQFLWSGQVISTGRNRIDGVGSNMGIMLFSDSKYLQSYTVQGATVAYSIRRLVR